VSDVVFDLEGLSGSASATPALTWGRARSGARLGWIGAAVAVLATLVALAIAYFPRAPVEVGSVRSFILPPEHTNFAPATAGPFAISPDGRRLAFVATAEDGKDLLWVRALDALSAQPLSTTEGATYPFWSPDSRFIGFFANGKLKKIEAAGGLALTLCDAPAGRGGTWNREGVIIFAPKVSGAPLHRVSASGGVPSPVTKLAEARGETAQRWPSFLPDGQHFLYLGGSYRRTGGESPTIYVGSLGSPESKLLLRVNSNAAYAQGYLLYRSEGEGSLVAQPFDTRRLEMTGDAIPVVQQVQVQGNLFRGVFSVSENGILAYQAYGGGGSQLAWFDRNGKLLGFLGDRAPYSTPYLSPDGKRVAVIIFDPRIRTRDLWIYEIARGLRTRFTYDPADEREAAWSPDGSRIVFNSRRKGHFDLYQKASNGAGSEELLLESNLHKYPTSWSPDGRFLLYDCFDPKTQTNDLWVLPLSVDRESRIRPGQPFPLLQTDANESHGQFSPDGRWIAYQSNESGRFEIYVIPFPGPGGKWQVSTSGGAWARWPRDGKEIIYWAPDHKLMAVEVKSKGATLEVRAVRPLFEVHPQRWFFFYDVTADGQRFLVNTMGDQRGWSTITLVQNWTADLKR
jgi:Tol biopolymer transport system component